MTDLIDRWTIGDVRALIAGALDDMHRRELCRKLGAHHDIAVREYIETASRYIALEVGVYGTRGGDISAHIPMYELRMEEDGAYFEGDGSFMRASRHGAPLAPIDCSIKRRGEQELASWEPTFAALALLARAEPEGASPARWREVLEAELTTLTLSQWHADADYARIGLTGEQALLGGCYERCLQQPDLWSAQLYEPMMFAFDEVGDLGSDDDAQDGLTLDVALLEVRCERVLRSAAGDHVMRAASKALAAELIARQLKREREIVGG